MSATLAWAGTGSGTKTGTANANVLDDLDTLITSKSGDASFFWQKAGKSSATTPRWLLLSRKDGSVGRIALIIFDSAPAANNAAILDTTPTSNHLLAVWFPAGNVNTLSNLTAVSGTVCGDDTGCVKSQSIGSTVATFYAANFAPAVFDCAEGIICYFNDPATTSGMMIGAGNLVVDGADVAYPCCFGNSSLNTFFSGGGWNWVVTHALAGGSAGTVRVNYGSANRCFYPARNPNSGWNNVLPSATDLMTDTGNTKAWFPPIPLLGSGKSDGTVNKGEGEVIKLRQIGYGPGTVGAFGVYNTTGPVNAARQICNRTAGATGMPWVTNFKI